MRFIVDPSRFMLFLECVEMHYVRLFYIIELRQENKIPTRHIQNCN
ncbi:MAG: hypothetical protein GWN88_18245 [Nitrospinaceae bacterium]|nr:hypothetical protein [Nitrospinaceae bacterium]NIS86892.1 hypothetical protein [Nitrospinaceae bacterium]NIU45929.1 hypothetical protein [Nitrospinaceae bacterium]NIU98089.1 hypothetical protein [Nitrospinaceae bacterium]NIW60667.1 hypothetical protein [Nitrospinaceae bacterium]